MFILFLSLYKSHIYKNFMSYLFLLIGLAMVLFGAHALTDGAAAIATRFHIPQIVIGLTIVAFGTSAPELIVSASSALRGKY